MNRTLGLGCALLLVSALAACSDGGTEPAGGCTSDDACAARTACEGGVCVALADGACRRAVDCAAPETCVNEACGVACAQHEDCPAHEACDAGACAVIEHPTCHKPADCDESETCVEDLCVIVEDCVGGICPAECDLAVNVARAAALQAAQPALAVSPSSGKQIRTFTKTFASLGGHPAVQCEAALQFRDLSGDGALQPYEDWTLAPAARAADLVERLDAGSRRALLAHPALGDAPTTASPGLLTATAALVDAGVRFGITAASTSPVTARAAWANALQARAEAAPLGVPFVLSSEPAHTSGPGRVHARGFSSWPPEAAIAAGRDAAVAGAYGHFMAQELRAVGVRLVLSPAGDLATDPRWPGAPWTFGEDGPAAAPLVEAFVSGAQGAALGKESVAVVLGHWLGAGAAKDGFDARLAKGKYVVFPAGSTAAHEQPFRAAIGVGLAGVMPGYAIPEAGPWSGPGGVNGLLVEQVGASFSADLVRRGLREGLGFDGLVVAPPGAVEDAGTSPLGAPWGVEGLTRPQRIAKAVGAGVDQLAGLGDLDALAQAGLTDGQLRTAATRALTLALRLGLFEDPYVDAAAAPGQVGTDAARLAARQAMNGGLVLLRNVAKPVGFLNGGGDGTQAGDPYNAGNGTGKVLPAPPGGPYLLLSNFAYFAGDFDLAYVRSVSAGYTALMNDASSCGWSFTAPISTDAERMACSDYVLVRVAAPWATDPDSGALGLPTASLTYAGTDPSLLAPVAAARAAIDARPGSRAQLVVIVDAWRPSVVAELLAPAYGVSALYVDLSGARPGNPEGDKVALDVMFGIFDGTGRLPFALPASDAAAGAQLPDLAGDGSDGTLVRGHGLATQHF